MHAPHNRRSGIVAAGNWIVDHMKVVDFYPEEQALANIRSESFSNGGSPYNILKNLSKLGATFPLRGIGLVGADTYGDEIRRDCKAHGIDTRDIGSSLQAMTSHTDVMVVESTGRRTFFHYRGANALLDVEHFDFANAPEKIFHLGYLLLLDSLDRVHGGESGAARVFKNASDAGLKVSADLVSEDSDRFTQVVFPCLPYIDYLFMNEFEAGRSTGIPLHGDSPDYDKLDQAAGILLGMGVREWVFIHFPAGVFAKNREGDIVTYGSVLLPREKVVSTLGAGDALAAGVLFGLHENWGIDDAIRLGVWSAAFCLQQLGCSTGVLHHSEYAKFQPVYSLRPAPGRQSEKI